MKRPDLITLLPAMAWTGVVLALLLHDGHLLPETAKLSAGELQPRPYIQEIPSSVFGACVPEELLAWRPGSTITYSGTTLCAVACRIGVNCLVLEGNDFESNVPGNQVVGTNRGVMIQNNEVRR